MSNSPDLPEPMSRAHIQLLPLGAQARKPFEFVAIDRLRQTLGNSPLAIRSPLDPPDVGVLAPCAIGGAVRDEPQGVPVAFEEWIGLRTVAGKWSIHCSSPSL